MFMLISLTSPLEAVSIYSANCLAIALCASSPLCVDSLRCWNVDRKKNRKVNSKMNSLKNRKENCKKSHKSSCVNLQRAWFAVERFRFQTRDINMAKSWVIPIMNAGVRLARNTPVAQNSGWLILDIYCSIARRSQFYWLRIAKSIF